MTPRQFVAQYKKHGSFNAVTRATGVTRRQASKAYRAAVEAGLMEPVSLGGRPKDYALKTPEQFVEAYRRLGSLRAMSVKYGMPRGITGQFDALHDEAIAKGLMDRLPLGAKTRDQMKTPEPIVDGRVRAIETRQLTVPRRGVQFHLFTSAQNNTHLHEQWFENLLAFKEHLGAKLYVGRFTYKKEAYGRKSVKPGKEPTALDRAALWYDPRLAPYVCDDRVEVAPGLVWCGEFNRLPTTTRPLSGFEAYTGRKSGIFPHVKIAMESVASMRHEPTKFNYTTGAVTVRNYVQKATGIKAEFHHCYGALLVEVDADGDWFCRQINADSEGTFYDLDMRVMKGKVTTGHRPAAILWGDIHVANIDPVVRQLAWGEGGLLDALRPREQHMGDVLDFRSRTHWESKDPHMLFKRWVQGTEDVSAEVKEVGEFLEQARRPWCKTVIIDSNHHDHLGRWLREQDGRRDPVNSEFWFAMQSRIYADIRRGEEPNYLRLGLIQAGYKAPDKLARFLGRDESYIICADANGGIECGLHGHAGPNGSRGSTRVYTKMGRKVNKEHDHVAAIMDGVYSAGTSSVLSPDWVSGPGAWSWSHVLTYENGKRAIMTMHNGKYRAGPA